MIFEISEFKDVSHRWDYRAERVKRINFENEQINFLEMTFYQNTLLSQNKKVKTVAYHRLKYLKRSSILNCCHLFQKLQLPLGK